MSTKELTDYVTLAGAVIAAAAGVWNLVIQMRGKHDQFFVRLGSLSPTIYEEMMLSVVSRSDHPIRLTDWGFIEANGTFTSIIMEWEVGAFHGEEIVSRGSASFESFWQHFETGYVRRERPLVALRGQSHTAKSNHYIRYQDAYVAKGLDSNAAFIST